MTTHAMRTEARPFEVYGRSVAIGKTSVLADCPFCAATLTIFVWSFHGCGKKRCSCGAVLHRDGSARKLVEVTPP